MIQPDVGRKMGFRSVLTAEMNPARARARMSSLYKF